MTLNFPIYLGEHFTLKFKISLISELLQPLVMINTKNRNQARLSKTLIPIKLTNGATYILFQSLTGMTNSEGLSIDPCDMPLVKGLHSEKQPSTTTKPILIIYYLHIIKSTSLPRGIL